MQSSISLDQAFLLGGKLIPEDYRSVLSHSLLSVLPLCPLLNSTQVIPYDVYHFHNSKSKPLIVWRLPTAEHLGVLFATRTNPLRYRHNLLGPIDGPNRYGRLFLILHDLRCRIIRFTTGWSFVPLNRCLHWGVSYLYTLDWGVQTWRSLQTVCLTSTTNLWTCFFWMRWDAFRSHNSSP